MRNSIVYAMTLHTKYQSFKDKKYIFEFDDAFFINEQLEERKEKQYEEENEDRCSSYPDKQNH